MAHRIAALAAVAAGGCAVHAQNATLQHLGSFSVPNAAFLAAVDFAQPAGKTLVISAFTGNPLAPDVLASIPDAGAALTGNISAIDAATVTTAITWPNTVTPIVPGPGIPSVAANSMLVAGGFLVPPKTVGAVSVLQLQADGSTVVSNTNISTDKGSSLFGGWFYHKAYFHDVDGDGCQDVMAARAYKPLFGTPAGEFVWMKQPCGVPDPLAPSLLPWQETVLVNGSYAPDVFTALTSLRNDTDEQVVYTSFFSGGGLAILQCAGCNAANGGNATWASAAASLYPILIDASIGQGFGAWVIDLNNDGRLDILATNHVDNATISGVYAYEAPLPPTPITDAAAWTKHTLATGFIVREPGLPGTQAAPGAATAVSHCASAGTRKPFLTVAGDGDQRFYTLVPNSEDPTDWGYTLTEVLDCQGTVGGQVAADLDGDGCDEVLVPCFDDGIVHAFKVVA